MARFADPFTDFERAFGRLDRTWPTGMMPMDAYTQDDNFDISIEKNVLSVTVERPHENTEGVTWAMRERPTGRHTRQVRIGDMVDVSHVDAAYDDGVLTVVMPLREETKPRRIDVNRKVLETSSA